MDTIIYNATIVNEGRRFNGYVGIEGNIIAEVGEGMPTFDMLKNSASFDVAGAYLLPGAIDTHVHFREPGLTRKATIASESAKAVAGGVTSFLDMPNTDPAATTEEIVESKKKIAAKSSFANYGFFIGATNDNIDSLLRADYTSIPGIKLFMGSSTGDMLVDNWQSLERLFAEFKGVIAVHAEDEATIRTNAEFIRRELGDKAHVSVHPLIRSREACMKASQVAVDLAKRFGSRLHLLHISTADELSLLSGGNIESKRITAETCPHYLTFTSSDLTSKRGFVRKCNPSIKGEADRAALRDAVGSDLIDIIATDHAPHLLAEKEGSVFTAASGMPGIKFMLPLMLDMTMANDRETPCLTVEQVVEKTAHNPARLYGIERRGFIRKGYFADLVIVSAPVAKPDLISDSDTTSHVPGLWGLGDGDISPKCNWTPYEGIPLSHRVMTTFVNGKRVFDGKKVDPKTRSAQELKFN